MYSERRMLGERPMSWGRKRASLVALVGLFLIAGVTPVLAGQKITVRFLDADSGKPLSRLWVSVDQLARVRRVCCPVSDEIVPPVILRTGEDGAVALELHDPPPAFILAGSAEGLRGGPHVPPVPTAKVLSTGVVFNWAPKGKKPKFHPTAKPGEIIIVGKRWTRWSRFLMEIP